MNPERPMAPPASAAPAQPRRPQRPHNPEATRQSITDAAVGLLLDRGFPGLGVNSLAAAAGVDKQLIYYHFGGLQGVVRHLVGQTENWLGAPLPAREGEAYAEAMQRLLLAYAQALRHNPLVLRLMAWELVEPAKLPAELEDLRSAALFGWSQPLRAAARPAPVGVDAPAIHALLLAGLQHLALRDSSAGGFAGIDVGTTEGANRIDAALRMISQRVFGTLR
jgi:AcrR family transcriptional regulator